MKRFRPPWFVTLIFGLLAAAGCVREQPRPTDTSSQDSPPAVTENYLPENAPVGATLLDGLGDYHMPISHRHRETQQWFDQGLILTYGFNHQAAERSFLKAVALDPDCAMCWWGAALVLGPHVNAGMDPASNEAAWSRLQKARSLAENASPRERDYIHALGARYAESAPEDRTALDRDYANAMGQLAQQYPDDLDAATLYAEALMNLQPWNYWDSDGQPVGHTAEIVRELERVIEQNNDHPGALHLYVHAVEASSEPERAEAAADRLRDLIPGSGHLVHMPAHIYARVGRWQDAVIANQKAIEADNAYLAACRPGPGVYPLGYVPHNHHFLWFAATMAGNREIALSAAQSTHERTSDETMMRMPGFEALQNFALTPLYARVRFGLWADIQSTPRPTEDLPYMVAMWEYAQGMAALRLEDVDAARFHHAALKEHTHGSVIDEMYVWGRYSLAAGVRVAERTLAAELAWAGDDINGATIALQEALAIEATMPYDEPPAWHAPVGQTLGAILLEADRAADAEAVYRLELKRNPENGWSLFGLEQALRAQGKREEAEEVALRFNRAWAHSDITLSASRL